MVNMRLDSPPSDQLSPAMDDSENFKYDTSNRSSEDYQPNGMFVHESGKDDMMSACRVNNPGPTMETEKLQRRAIANNNERRRMQSINVGFQSLRSLLPKRDGEKISKAAILQSTAEFIHTLQLEKSQLLLENEHLRKILDANGIDLKGRTSNAAPPQPQSAPTQSQVAPITPPAILPKIPIPPPKKRRRYYQENAESSDEGVGMVDDSAPLTTLSISPNENKLDREYQNLESVRLTPQMLHQEKARELEKIANQNQLFEMQMSLERERHMRIILEDQLRQQELNRLQQNLGRLTTMPNGHNLLDFSPANHSLMSNSALMPPLKHAVDTLVGMRNAAGFSLASMPPPMAPPHPHPSTSNKNLDVIVEAIRHLEGDQLFVNTDLSRLPLHQSQSVYSRSGLGALLEQSFAVDSGINSPVAGSDTLVMDRAAIHL